MGSSDALRAQQRSMRMTPVVAAQQFFSAIAASPRASYSYHQVLISPSSARVVSPGAWRTPVVPIGTAILAPAGTSAGAPQHVEPELGQEMRGLIREVGSTLLAGSRSVLRRTGALPKCQLRAGALNLSYCVLPGPRYPIGQRKTQPCKHRDKSKGCHEPWLPQAEAAGSDQGAGHKSGVEIGLGRHASFGQCAHNQQTDKEQQRRSYGSAVIPSLKVDVVAVQVGRQGKWRAGRQGRAVPFKIVHGARRVDA